MTASVGDFTSSITMAKGSRTPVASSASRSAIRGSNLEKRSLSASAVRIVDTIRSALRLQLGDGIDKLADRLDLGLHVHGDDDVELIFHRRHEIHHRQAVPFKIAGEGGGLAQRDALLVERLDLRCDLREELLAVRHGATFFPVSGPVRPSGKPNARFA